MTDIVESVLSVALPRYEQLLSDLRQVPIVPITKQDNPTKFTEARQLIEPHVTFDVPALLPGVTLLSELPVDSPEWSRLADESNAIVDYFTTEALAYTDCPTSMLTLVVPGGSAQIPRRTWMSLPKPARSPSHVHDLLAAFGRGFVVDTYLTPPRIRLERPPLLDESHGLLARVLAEVRHMFSREFDAFSLGHPSVADEYDALVAALESITASLFVGSSGHSRLLHTVKAWREKENPAPNAWDVAASRAARLEQMMEAYHQSKDATSARIAFDTFPILSRRARMARASRTWGVELEVIDAGNVHKLDIQNRCAGAIITKKSLDVPQGWSAVRDGSLRNMIGDGKWYDPWEFVSPVFDRTFDAGLQHLCSQVEGTIKYARAGVHVHVNATDRHGNTLSSGQVGSLLELYNAVSPLFAPFLERRTIEFCKPYDYTEWAQAWFGRDYPEKAARYAVGDPRRERRGRAGVLSDAKQNVMARIKDYKTTADDNTHRYRDVNLESLVKHGTIEFRAMGAVYKYESIIRWAWMCREMVNYVAADRPVKFLANSSTLDEFLARLRSTAVESLSVSRSDPFINYLKEAS